MEIQADRENKPLMIGRHGNVATITINRPSRKNAVSHAMWRNLAAEAAALGCDPMVRVIVLRGAGHDFCAGADIAAIRGICFGGGFGLAAACDLRIATPDALFSVPAAKLGLAYPHDAMADIVHAAGPQMAKYLAFSAARIDARAALAAGFLLEIVEPDDFETRISALADEIATNAPLSNRASKAAIRAVLSGNPADISHARTMGDETFDSADYAEGRAAFAARRKPVFVGK